MRIWPWSRFRELDDQIAALAAERSRGWLEISRLEDELSWIRWSRSEASRKGNATRRARVLATTERLRAGMVQGQ